MTFSRCERSKLPIVINVLHRIYIVFLIFILHLSELQVFLNISSYVSYYCILFGKPGQFLVGDFSPNQPNALSKKCFNILTAEKLN